MAHDVRERLAAHTLGGRSALYRWLHQHHDEIAPVLTAQHRPGWQALAATVAEAGIRTLDGHLCSRHLVRKTWKSLERDKAKPAQQQPASTLKSIPTPKPIPSVEPATSPTRHTFQVAKFKTDKDR